MPKRSASIDWFTMDGGGGTSTSGVYCNGARLLPESLNQVYQRPAQTLPRVEGELHEIDWVRACKSGQPAGLHFGYSGPLTEICLLGNLAKRMNGRIDWDPVNLKATNLPEANQYVHTTYRQGWPL